MEKVLFVSLLILVIALAAANDLITNINRSNKINKRKKNACKSCDKGVNKKKKNKKTKLLKPNRFTKPTKPTDPPAPTCSDYSENCGDCYESGCTFLNESRPKKCVAYADSNCPIVEPTDDGSCVGLSDGFECKYEYAIKGCTPETFACTPGVQYTCNKGGLWEKDFLPQIACIPFPMVPEYGQACNPDVYTPTGSIFVGGFESEIERKCFEYGVNDRNYNTCKEASSTGGTCDSCVETLLETMPGIINVIAPTCNYFLDTGVCAPTSCVFTGIGGSQDCSGTMFCPVSI